MSTSSSYQNNLNVDLPIWYRVATSFDENGPISASFLFKHNYNLQEK